MVVDGEFGVLGGLLFCKNTRCEISIAGLEGFLKFRSCRGLPPTDETSLLAELTFSPPNQLNPNRLLVFLGHIAKRVATPNPDLDKWLSGVISFR